MVFSVEAMIYVPGKLGARIEDNVMELGKVWRLNKCIQELAIL
jgi:Xaa-Pro aminopeptidase